MSRLAEVIPLVPHRSAGSSRDFGPDLGRGAFARMALEGLTAPRKWLHPKFLYDERGSALFERLRECPEYYVPRAEESVLRAHADQIADELGPKALLIELGSGASVKTRIVLDRLRAPSAYIPVDISREFLLLSARDIERAYPGLSVLPLCADFTEPLELPEIGLPADHGRRVGFFPGSTIGNFDRPDALVFLHRIAGFLGPGGALLIGVDLVKDKTVLEAAYNDTLGITAEFNLNLITRMRNELGVDVDPSAFRHLAFYNPRERRIEMHLESLRAQEFRLFGQSIRFARGETIHTESSYKYLPAHFEEMTRQAGFVPKRFWTDPRRYFAVFLLEVPGRRPEAVPAA